MAQPPRDPAQPLLSPRTLGAITADAVVLSAATLGVHAIALARGGPRVGTMAFSALTAAQLGNALTLRTRGEPSGDPVRRRRRQRRAARPRDDGAAAAPAARHESVVGGGLERRRRRRRRARHPRWGPPFVVTLKRRRSAWPRRSPRDPLALPSRPRARFRRAASSASSETAISSGQVLSVGVLDLVRTTLVTAVAGARDVGAELGTAGVSAVRGSIRAAHEIGGDVGIGRAQHDPRHHRGRGGDRRRPRRRGAIRHARRRARHRRHRGRRRDGRAPRGRRHGGRGARARCGRREARAQRRRGRRRGRRPDQRHRWPLGAPYARRNDRRRQGSDRRRRGAGRPATTCGRSSSTAPTA